MKGRWISDKTKEEIIGRIQAGEAKAEIAREYEISRESVRRIFRNFEKQEKAELGEWFRPRWANIYPGDEVRNERAKEALNQSGIV